MDSPNFSSLTTSQQIQNPLLQTILIVIVLVVFGWFVLGPKYTQTSQTREQLAAVEEQRANLEADQEELNRLISKLEQSEDEVKLLDEAVPLTARPTRIALLMETLAQNTGLTLTQMSIGQTDEFIASGNKEELKDPLKAPRELATIEVSASTSGTVEQFRNFLTLLEQSGRIIDVSSLTVNSSDQGPSYNIRLKTYAYEISEKTTPGLAGEVGE